MTSNSDKLHQDLYRSLPRIIALDDDAVSSALGIHHSLFLHSSGQISALGSNRKGQHHPKAFRKLDVSLWSSLKSFLHTLSLKLLIFMFFSSIQPPMNKCYALYVSLTVPPLFLQGLYSSFVSLVLPRCRSCSLYLGFGSTLTWQYHSVALTGMLQLTAGFSVFMEDGNTASSLAGYIAGMQRHDAWLVCIFILSQSIYLLIFWAVNTCFGQMLVQEMLLQSITHGFLKPLTIIFIPFNMLMPSGTLFSIILEASI